MHSRSTRGALAVLACLSGACGMQSPRSPESSAPERAPTSLPEAQAQLDAALRELGVPTRAPGASDKAAPATDPAPEPPRPKTEEAEKKGDKPDAAPPAPPAPPSRAPEAPTSSHEAGEQRASGKKLKSAESACDRACRAYASLKRAVEAVCRLAGDPSSECTSARERETVADQRVASCSCSR